MKRGILLVPLLAVTLSLAAQNWPVGRPVVTGTFGECREDHFNAGIDIGGGEQDVFPVIEGELVFRYDEDADYSSLPRGIGSFAVLRHSMDLLSIYCHLKKQSIPLERTVFTRVDRLGVIGDTGDSEGKQLHLEIFDLETSSFENPLYKFLPPIPDRQPPVIKQITLKMGEKLFTMSGSVAVPAGRGEILAEAYDPREDVRYLWPMAPFGIRLALNGKEVSRLQFDSLAVREGKMVDCSTSLGVGDVYGEARFVRFGIVELRSGESHLLVSARDVAGNETAKEVFFKVSE